MTQTFVPGTMQELVSNIEFSLNFEDKKGSVKVKVGDTVHYDGVQARFIKNTGEEILGRSTSLRSAVTRNWLTCKSASNAKATEAQKINMNPVKVNKDGVVYKEPEYDSLKGGSFDTYLKGETAPEKTQVIKEEDQVVKKTDFTETKEEKQSPKIVKDLEDVGTVRPITSSTSVNNSTTKRHMPVIQSDDGHAEHTIVKRASVTPEVKTKKNSFTVDNTTPRLAEEATMAEVTRATGSGSGIVEFSDSQDARIVKKSGAAGKLTVDLNESQDAKVIGKIGVPAPRMADEPTEVEGIVLKRTAVVKSSGSTPVADLSGVRTQSEVNAIEKEIEKGVPENKTFVDMLPENWSAMHWTKKEKFILQLTDKEFLQFIMTVEGTKAIQNACKKRLTELEK